MSKYTQQNIIFDGSTSFIKNVNFDSLVTLKGVTKISTSLSASNDYALVVSSNGSNITINSRHLGTMAWESANNYTLKTLFDSSIAYLTNWNNAQDSSIGLLYQERTNPWNGISITADNSIGLGGSLDIPTTITTSDTNTLSLLGLQSGTTRLAVILDNGVLKTQQLGTMSLESSGSFVKKSGDTMTGELNITGGGLNVGTSSVNQDTALYGNLYVKSDLSVSGNLRVDGSIYSYGVESIDVSSGYILLNSGQTGVPPTTMQSGIVVDRGSEDPYVFLYDESNQDFRIGIAHLSGATYVDASTQSVATKEDTPTSYGLAYYSNSDYRFNTNSKLTFNPNVGLTLDSSLILTNLSSLSSENTALFINSSGVVGKRVLTSAAFTNPANITYDSPISVSNGTGAVLKDVSISISKADGSTDGYLSSTDWNIFNNKQNSLDSGTGGDVNILLDSSIATLKGGTAISLSGTPGNLITINSNIATSSTLGVVYVGPGISITGEGQITPHWGGTGIATTVSRSDHNHNNTYIGNLDDATNASGHSIIASADSSTAYLKYITQGNGITITSDSSTVKVALTNYSTYSNKFTADFDGTAGTSTTILASTHNLGTGPFVIAVYDGNERVYTDESYNVSGDVTLSWTLNSLSSSCKLIIIG